MSSTYLLPSADINWNDGTPTSGLYGDIYWHQGEALAEKQHVFLSPFKHLLAEGGVSHQQQVTVAELGFGFGINCLVTAAFWQAAMPKDTVLQFISIEKHPISQKLLQTHLAEFGFAHTSTLLEQYPPPIQGQHVIWLAENIRLLLIFADAEQALSQLDAAVDMWYLDGFSPASNEAMWQTTLFRKLFARSRPGAKLSSYSVAGTVRRALTDSGFSVTKTPGFGRKLEMLSATKTGVWQPQVRRSPSVTVIGGGLAGRFLHEAFSKRGISARIIDAARPRPSDVPQLAVYPQLAVAAEAKQRFSLAAFQYMQGAAGFHQTGVIFHPRSDEEAARLSTIERQFPDEMIRVAGKGAIEFVMGGWWSLAEFEACYPADITQTKVSKIHAADDGWHCYHEGKLLADSDVVILATGHDRTFMPETLEIRAIRGQAITIPTNDIRGVLTGPVTVFPTVNGKSVVSGTYDRSTSEDPSEEDTNELLTAASRLLETPCEHAINVHVGIRAASRDRLPIIDGAPRPEILNTIGSQVHRAMDPEHYQPGLFLFTAFGSRGATHARLCAEQLASRILGEPGALDFDHQQMLSATRFALRDARNRSSIN